MRPLVLILATATVAHAAEPAGQPNRLAKESSPYLLQHAHNPVDWFPWGPEAFAKAKKEGKLVFLSVGYSSCHWCHVMEKESFSNPGVAKILNEHFVCIKVDREERPDVDDLYMASLNVLGNQGGWPMSVFLTAEAKPIFGGTYWPPDDREIDGNTIPGFKSILNSVVELNRDKRKELLGQADAVAERTAAALDRAGGDAITPLNADLVRLAAIAFDFDPEYGGIGRKFAMFRGTKFPKAPALRFLLLGPTGDDAKAARDGVFLTLDHMAAGGIYDHLGGGFHRYSTERTWTVPHFEKMLYDNAQLVELYTDAHAIDPKPAYQRVVRETLDFVTRELTSPEGVFYSALDADSEGEEGRFYVWTPAELAEVLGDTEPETAFRAAYLTAGPNFEEKYHILRKPGPDTKVDLATVAPVMAKLFAARSRRERPFLDTKVLCGWNGLMIAGYARAGQVFDEPKYIASAEKAAEFILTRMRDEDGRLKRVFAAPPGEKPIAYGTAFLDDYAFLTHGLLALHTATGDAKWLREARSVTDTMLKWYADTDRGGFFTTPSDGETLFARGKDSYDGAVPSGNGTAVLNLVRLWAATGDEKYRTAAERTFRHFAGTMRINPEGSPVMSEALAIYLAKSDKESGPGEPEKPPANPRRSSDVVRAKLTLGPIADGRQPVEVALTIAKPWHIYANPPGGQDLEASATRLTVTRSGKPVDIEWTFPAGDEATDTVAGKYRIYQGTIRITGSILTGDGGPLTVNVNVMACQEGKCLLPGTLTVTSE